MITLEDVRNAKLQDLFCVTIVKELTWEEAEEYPLNIEGLPSGITANGVLQHAVQSILEKSGKLSDVAVEETVKEIKKQILSCLQETQNTIVLKKDNQYFDLADMAMLDTRYKVKREVPFSKYGTEKDFKIVSENGILEFSIEDGIFEKYLEEFEQYNSK